MITDGNISSGSTEEHQIWLYLVVFFTLLLSLKHIGVLKAKIIVLSYGVYSNT